MCVSSICHACVPAEATVVGSSGTGVTYRLVISYLVWLLGIEPGFSGRAICF